MGWGVTPPHAVGAIRLVMHQGTENEATQHVPQAAGKYGKVSGIWVPLVNLHTGMKWTS